MKKVIVVLTVIFLMNNASSQVTQEWSARYNGPGNLGDGASKLAVDSSGNVFVTGYSMGSGTDEDYSTRKYNSSGGQLWTSRYNGTGNSVDRAYSIAVDGSGNVYVTGLSRSGTTANTEDYATIKYNSSGIQQWASRYNGSLNSYDAAYAIALDNSGNVYVTGSSFGSGGSGSDYVTIKYNSSGAEQWVRRYNGTGNSTDEAYRIAVSDSGNVYVTGYSRSGSGAGSEDCTTIKYNSAGAQQWVQRFNNGANDLGLAVAVDASGNVYVAGFAWNGFSSLDYLTLKYNASGIQQWSRVEVQSGIGVIFSLAIDGTGNVFVTGYSWDEGSGFNDYLTIKYNSSGVYLWGSKYNGPANGADTAYSLAVDGSGNVYVTGSSSGSGTGTDYATVKYNSSGVQQWAERYNGTGNSADAAVSIAVDSWGYVYITGVSAGSGSGADYETIKYSQTGSMQTLNLTAFIEGFYNSDSNSMVSDTVTAYLRNATSPYNKIDSAKVKLNSTGAGVFNFSSAMSSTNYYLVVRHRNSIETWSKSVVAFTAGLLTYDFSTSSNKAYGNNQKQIDTSPVRFSIFNGNFDQNSFINLADVLGVYNAASSFVTGYIVSDMNGDNLTDLSDLIITSNNSNGFVIVMRP